MTTVDWKEEFGFEDIEKEEEVVEEKAKVKH